MTEVASVVAALAAVGALFFAWRTVVEARAAHAEDERDRLLARIEGLTLRLTDLAIDLDAGSIAQARITQARARVLWATAGTDFGDHVSAVMNGEITMNSAADLADEARVAIEDLLNGLEDFVAA